MTAAIAALMCPSLPWTGPPSSETKVAPHISAWCASDDIDSFCMRVPWRCSESAAPPQSAPHLAAPTYWSARLLQQCSMAPLLTFACKMLSLPSVESARPPCDFDGGEQAV